MSAMEFRDFNNTKILAAELSITILAASLVYYTLGPITNEKFDIILVVVFIIFLPMEFLRQFNLYPKLYNWFSRKPISDEKIVNNKEMIDVERSINILNRTLIESLKIFGDQQNEFAKQMHHNIYRLSETFDYLLTALKDRPSNQLYEQIDITVKRSISIQEKLNLEGLIKLSWAKSLQIEGKSEQSIQMFEQSIDLLTKGENEYLVSLAMYDLGSLYLSIGNSQKANKLFAESVKKLSTLKIRN